MAVPILGGLIALASSAVVKMLIDRVLFFLALKALLTALMIIVFPIMIKNIVFSLMSSAMQLVNATPVDGYSGLVEFTQLAAWLIETCRVPDCIAILVSAFQLHLLLRLLPFSPVKK